jgi:hypothetical protein
MAPRKDVMDLGFKYARVLHRALLSITGGTVLVASNGGRADREFERIAGVS